MGFSAVSRKLLLFSQKPSTSLTVHLLNNEFIIVSLHLVFQNLTETKVFDASLLLVKEGN
jgi:hypothetical protein